VNARRFASIAGTVAVTGIAAVASYDHTRVLALQAGQPAVLAALLPLSVDGMILVATLALGDGRRSRWSAWLAFLVGVAASLAANVMAAPPGAVARVVSAWPAIALLLTVEVLARSGRVVTAPVPADVPGPVETAPVAGPAPLETVPANDPVLSDVPADQPTKRPRRAATEVRAEALALIAQGRTRKATAEHLGLSERRLRTVLNGNA
jgi:hypothetical protein